MGRPRTETYVQHIAGTVGKVYGLSAREERPDKWKLSQAVLLLRLVELRLAVVKPPEAGCGGALVSPLLEWTGRRKSQRTVQIGSVSEPQAVRHKCPGRASVDLVRFVGKLVDERREDSDVDESEEGLVKAEEELRRCRQPLADVGELLGRQAVRVYRRTGVHAWFRANCAQYSLSAESATAFNGEPGTAASNALTMRCEAAPIPM